MEPVTEVPIPDTAKMTLLPSSVPINQQEAMSLPPPHVIHLKGNHVRNFVGLITARIWFIR